MKVTITIGSKKMDWAHNAALSNKKLLVAKCLNAFLSKRVWRRCEIRVLETCNINHKTFLKQHSMFKSRLFDAYFF